MNENQAYYESVMPGMTKEQALYINSHPYDQYPYEVKAKALAIATSIQEEYAKCLNGRSNL